MPEHENEHNSLPPGGALEELARDDVARKKFLTMAGKTMGAAGAASALGIFLAACGGNKKSSSSSSAPSTSSPSSGGANGDLAIVNYALTLEYLESQFYGEVIKSGLFSGKTLSTIKMFGHQEREHVLALEKVSKSLGKLPARPQGKFELKDATSVAKLAATVENLGAAAYLGAAGDIKSPEILAAALAIHTIEARHAAVLNTLTKQSPTPDGGFGKPMSMDAVLAAVKPFIAA